MIRAFVWLLAVSVWSLAGCVSSGPRTQSPNALKSTTTSCDLAAASPWITRWFAAWELTSQQILRLPDAQPPDIVFYDSSCVYTTSKVTAPASPIGNGPALRGTRLSWRAAVHNDTLTLPNAKKVPVRLMSFTDSDKNTGPFFVMAAPDYWTRAGSGQEPGLTAVFLHEFAHTRQLRGFAKIIGPIDSAWKFPEELSDDAVQTHFASDSAYVTAYLAERDLLYRAAAADSLASVRTLAAEALAMIRGRHGRWFTGDNAVFAILDDTWLSLEGVGQWAGYAWLAHAAGGGLDRPAAVARMLGHRRWWVQDEGLAIFLVVDRLLPGWPSLVFRQPSIGAVELLERAIQ